MKKSTQTYLLVGGIAAVAYYLWSRGSGAAAAPTTAELAASADATAQGIMNNLTAGGLMGIKRGRR